MSSKNTKVRINIGVLTILCCIPVFLLVSPWFLYFAISTGLREGYLLSIPLSLIFIFQCICFGSILNNFRPLYLIDGVYITKGRKIIYLSEIYKIQKLFFNPHSYVIVFNSEGKMQKMRLVTGYRTIINRSKEMDFNFFVTNPKINDINNHLKDVKWEYNYGFW